VGSLYVSTEAGNPAWSIESNPQGGSLPTNLTQSGVIYGTVPPQAHEFIPSVPLVSGQTYRILLYVTNSQGEATEVGRSHFDTPAE
jgi:hypothetical protein